MINTQDKEVLPLQWCRGLFVSSEQDVTCGKPHAVSAGKPGQQYRPRSWAMKCLVPRESLQGGERSSALELAAAEQGQSHGVLRVWPNLLLAAGPAPPSDLVAQGLPPVRPWDLRGWRCHSLSAPLLQRPAVLRRKRFFLVSGWDLSLHFTPGVWVAVS